jgi:hypothetical protein
MFSASESVTTTRAGPISWAMFFEFVIGRCPLLAPGHNTALDQRPKTKDQRPKTRHQSCTLSAILALYPLRMDWTCAPCARPIGSPRGRLFAPLVHAESGIRRSVFLVFCSCCEASCRNTKKRTWPLSKRVPAISMRFWTGTISPTLTQDHRTYKLTS